MAKVIYRYTRAQAIEDSVLVDVSATAREAGIAAPVVLTAAAWADSVAWSQEDTERQRIHQDEAGRLWDVLWMLRFKLLAKNNHQREVLFPFYRVPRDGRTREAQQNHLKAVCHGGDNGEPVITIAMPDES